jgi:hypothetical protein
MSTDAAIASRTSHTVSVRACMLVDGRIGFPEMPECGPTVQSILRGARRSFPGMRGGQWFTTSDIAHRPLPPSPRHSNKINYLEELFSGIQGGFSGGYS